jgi:uncharacterized protein (DUF983 family)
MGNVLDYLLGLLRLRARKNDAGENDTEPRYGKSVSYLPCPNCGEGSLVYDEDTEQSVCNSCGIVDDGPST